MWKLVRYRPGQTLTIGLLAAVVVASAVFATLYDRATQQALVDVELSHAPVQESGLRLSTPNTADLPTAVDELTQLLPDNARHLYEPPVGGAHGLADVVPEPGTPSPVGQMMWRADFCAHVKVTRGRCPRGAGEVAVSEADADWFGYRPGTTVRFAGDKPTPESATPIGSLRVVGVYRQPTSAYWFGERLTGMSGVSDQTPEKRVQHDTWLTPEATFEARDIPRLPEESATVEFALNLHKAGVDEVTALAPMTSRLMGQALGTGFTAATGLPDIAAEVTRQRDQTRVTVPLLMVQLGLLVVVVFWLVLDTICEQRRPELALSLLHGRGRRGARWRLGSELLPPVFGGALLGAVAAVAACTATTRMFLPGQPGVELRAAPVLAAVGSVGVLVTLVGVAAWRVMRAPVLSLLRTVGARPTAWGLGAWETFLLVASGTTVLGFVTGWLSGPVALAGPMLLALVVGLLLAHVVVPVAASSGNWLLRRGRVVVGVSVLGAARGQAARRTVAIVTVATALLVFSADMLVVGGRNRAAAAEHVAGARLVADVDGTDLAAVRRALREADPGGHAVTPVVSVHTPGIDATQTLAVVPDRFRSIALVRAGDVRSVSWNELTPPNVGPLDVTGARLTGIAETPSFLNSSSMPARLSLTFATDDGGQFQVALGPVGTSRGQHHFAAPIPCRTGCTLTGVEIDTTPGARMSGTVALRGVRVDGHALDFGNGRDWYVPAPESATTEADQTTGISAAAAGPPGEAGASSPPAAVTADEGRLAVTLSSDGGGSVIVRHAWIPESLPAIVAGRLRSGGTVDSFSINGLDGLSRVARQVGTAPSLPGTLPNTALVNLDVAQRGVRLEAQDRISLWFARADPGLLARVTHLLRGAGVTVIGTRTLADAQRVQDQSLAAWSLELATVVAAACLLLAVLVLLVIAVSTRRLRSRDLASLRLAGLGSASVHRIAALEPALAVALAVLAGVGCGLVGAQISLPTVPILASTPEAFTLDLAPAWAAIAVTGGAALAVLVAVAWATGRAIARRAALARVRETI